MFLLCLYQQSSKILARSDATYTHLLTDEYNAIVIRLTIIRNLDYILIPYKSGVTYTSLYIPVIA